MPADPAQLPAELSNLLDKTLGKKGNPGILADWIDDHSSHWAPFAEALRVSEPFVENKASSFGLFRYRFPTDGVAFMITEQLSSGYPQKPDGIVLTVYRTTESEQAKWQRLLPQKAVEGGLGERLKEAIGEPAKPKKPAAKKKTTAKKPKPKTKN